MSTYLAASLAMLFSLPPLLWLALRDPKRLRSLRKAGPSPAKPGARRLLASAAALPGIVLAGLGLWPPLLIWIGGVTLAGWLFAQALAGHRPGGP